MEATALDRLELDIDSRMVDLWEQLDKFLPDHCVHPVAICLRVAYTRGYEEALLDPEPGEFFVRHGYPTPERRAVS